MKKKDIFLPFSPSVRFCLYYLNGFSLFFWTSFWYLFSLLIIKVGSSFFFFFAGGIWPWWWDIWLHFSFGFIPLKICTFFYFWLPYAYNVFFYSLYFITMLAVMHAMQDLFLHEFSLLNLLIFVLEFICNVYIIW